MKNIFLLSLIFIFSTLVFSEELPLFDYPYNNTSTTNTPTPPGSIFSPGGDLEDIEEQISVSLSVANPQPNQPFNISVRSFSSNLNKASIYWYENNELKSSGVGDLSQSYVAPGIGKSLIIGLRIETIEGNLIVKEYEISPALVDLIYETQTYTPPFYKGKAIYTHQSTATIYALPSIIEDGIKKNPSSLIYTWEVNGSVQQDSSGRGRDVFLYEGRILSQSTLITITVESDTSNQVAINDIFLEPADAEVLLVQEHPLYGMISNNNIETDSDYVVIHAIPLFSSIFSKESSSLDYVWSLNGVELGEENNSSIISFQSTEGNEGEASLALRIDNKLNFLQSTSGSTSVLMKKAQELIQGSSGDFSF